MLWPALQDLNLGHGSLIPVIPHLLIPRLGETIMTETIMTETVMTETVTTETATTETITTEITTTVITTTEIQTEITIGGMSAPSASLPMPLTVSLTVTNEAVVCHLLVTVGRSANW
jgi:hypothetical protein